MLPRLAVFMHFNKEVSRILFWSEHVRSTLESTDHHTSRFNFQIACLVSNANSRNSCWRWIHAGIIFICELNKREKGSVYLCSFIDVTVFYKQWDTQQYVLCDIVSLRKGLETSDSLSVDVPWARHVLGVSLKKIGNFVWNWKTKTSERISCLLRVLQRLKEY